MAGAASCSSSSAAPFLKKLYDVFISFRGEDTRENFISHLYAALSRNQIQTYKDDITLEKGDEVWPALVHAIHNSYLCIVVFSKNYASSTWCLRELTHILECKKEKQVIPVFYLIDPSHVRKQTGSYKEAFDKYEKDFKLDQEILRKWKAALEKAANFSGFHSKSKEHWDENQLIENIVKDVWQKLEEIYPRSEPKDLVGTDKILAHMDLLLRKFRSIGLWGMGGIGKTTIARIVFNRYSSRYESHCFLENVSENSGKLELGLYGLRKKLLSKLLKGENIRIDAESAFVESKLKYKTVFIVFDDVDTPEQIEYLVREINCFGPGSKIIITTRDKHVLERRVDKIHEVEGLDFQESLHLFCMKAFNRDHPQMGFKELSNRVVFHSQGLPLALKLLGSFLRSRSKEAWENALEKLKKYPYKPIENVLRLSYDGLDDEEKEIFLDIAFFFKGESKKDVENYLNACNFYATIGLEALQDKALITISDQGEVRMHDLIQEMGWEIVREKYINDPGIRSRLRDPKEVCDVLKNNKGSDAIEGIIVDVSQIEDLHLSGDAFKKMTKLRFLKFYFPYFLNGNVSIPRVYPSGSESFSDSLKYFCWDAYPLEFLPPALCLEKLVELHIQGSQIKRFGDGVQDLSNLKKINIMRSTQLMEFPNFSMALNLELINLSYCESLHHVPATFCAEKLVSLEMCNTQIEKLWDGVQDLVSLKDINLSGSKRFIELPDFSKASKLEAVSLSFCKNLSHVHPSLLSLQWLRHLCLHGCKNIKSLQSVASSENLEDFSLSWPNIKRLSLEHTAIDTLPSSIGSCSNLQELHLSESLLKSLPNELSNLRSLGKLIISDCRQLDTWNLDIILDGLRFLKDLVLHKSNVESLPACIKHLLSLQYIGIINCRRLHTLPELPPSLELLHADDCMSLETVINSNQIEIIFQTRWRIRDVFQKLCEVG